MEKYSIAVLLLYCSVSSIAAVPEGKIEKPFAFNNDKNKFRIKGEPCASIH